MSGFTHNTQSNAIGTHSDRLLLTPTGGLSYRESDTGVVYRGNGTSWDLWNPIGGVVKSADQTLTQQNTTPQSITDLLFPIEVNETWFVETFLFLNSVGATSDFKATWSTPTSATAMWGPVATRGEGVPVSAWNASAAANAPAVMGTASDTTTFASVVGTTGIEIMGTFTADSTHAGNVQLQVSQATSTAEDDKVLKGSWIRLRRLS